MSRLPLAAGHTVLDLRCGAGASAIPAARVVGPAGHVLGIFAPDMAAFVAEMWRLVRSGGVLAITTWGAGLFEPANTAFWESVRAVEPSLYKAFNPWDVITTEAALADLLRRGGVTQPAVMAVPGWHQLNHPDSFWDIALGTGYRATIDALSQEQRELVRSRVLDELRSGGTTSLRTDVIFGSAQRPI
jgi:SAM-dependent methyltransferase